MNQAIALTIPQQRDLLFYRHAYAYSGSVTAQMRFLDPTLFRGNGYQSKTEEVEPIIGRVVAAECRPRVVLNATPRAAAYHPRLPTCRPCRIIRRAALVIAAAIPIRCPLNYIAGHIVGINPTFPGRIVPHR